MSTRETEDRTLRPSATERYKFAGLRVPDGPSVSPDQKRFYKELAQWITLREGALGNAQERVVLKRDLDAAGLNNATQMLLLASQQQGTDSSGVPVPGTGPGGSNTVTQALERFAQSIVGTRVFQNLLKGIDDPTRFSDFSQEVQDILLRRIDEEAKQRGAAIRRIEKIQQSASFSQAIAVQEVTASVMGAMAGVRVTTFATAEAGRATAGQVTQLFASLDGTDNQVAAIEQTMFVQADSITGLEAQYTLKLTAGGAIAGFGIAASSPVGGTPYSAAIFRVDRFAIVPTTYTGGPTLNPAAQWLPFGVDATGIYVGVDILCRGRGYFDGVSTRNGFQGAGFFNMGQAAPVGVIGCAANGTGVVGFTGPAAGFPESTGARGVGGFAKNGVGGWFQIDAGGSGTGIGVRVENLTSGKKVSLGANDYAVKVAIGEGSVYFGGTVLPFTGAHPSLVPKELALEIGDIIIDGEQVEAPDVSNAIFEGEPCTEARQYGAIGVLSERGDLAEEVSYSVWWHYQHTHDLVYANGVGEGQINVCGRGGLVLKPGDLVECSDLAGKGQRQLSKRVRSSTVARLRIPRGKTVVFSHPDEVKMIPCVYLCGG